MTGQTITHYKVLEKLGGGGMGVVYRATDLRLNRSVALKFLTPELTTDDLAKERFVTEAQAASALDHSNICTIHEIAETSDGHSFIVMSYYEGETLKERIARGPLKIDEALDIAIGIGSALEAAHEAHILHRDIKPANVILTRRGETKVVDFGLAKLHSAHAVTEAAITQVGTLLGTAAYMSPEQARAGPVDHRTDIWALGVVLYEMISGRLPFAGERSTMVQAAAHEPVGPLTSVRTGVPIELDRIIGRALAKRPEDRYQSVADLISELKLLRRESDRRAMVTETRGAIPQPSHSARNVAVGMIALTLIGAGAAYFLASRRSDAEASPTFANLAQVTSGIGVEDYPTMSPDGRTLAYEADQSGNLDIWVAQIGGGAAINRTPDHTGDDRFPSWSPDGRQIAFWSSRDGGGCSVMPALAGTARKVATSGRVNLSRPQWSKDSSTVACVVAPLDAVNNVSVALVALTSGDAKQVPLPGVGRRFDLAWSQDGGAFAYVDSSAGLGSDVSQLLAVRIGSDKAIEVTDGRSSVRSPFWSIDGRTLYFATNREGAMDLWRQRFSSDGALDGVPTRVTMGLDIRQASLSIDGTKVAYSKGRNIANVWRVPILRDRAASWSDAKQITFDRAYVEFVDVSPDGQTLAVSSDRSGNHDLWLMPADSGEMRPLTSDPTPDWAPAWSPDGKLIAFYSYRTGNRDVWVMPAGGGPARQLTDFPGADLRPHWLPDGRRIAYISARNGPSGEWIVSVDGGPATQLAAFGQGDYSPYWSSDGRWMIFSSSRSGEPRIWRANADGTNPQQMSSRPGNEPIWSRDGSEVYFRGMAERSGNIWALSLADRKERPVTALTGRRGTLMVQSPATDGRRLFFSWQEDDGDIWVMDVVGAAAR